MLQAEIFIKILNVCHNGPKCSVLLAGISLSILLFAAGSRARVYSFMFSAALAGMSIGPCAAAATFAITGNKWDVDTLQRVVLVGMALAVLPILTLLCFDDDRSLGPESDAVTHSYTSPGERDQLLAGNVVTHITELPYTCRAWPSAELLPTVCSGVLIT